MAVWLSRLAIQAPSSSVNATEDDTSSTGFSAFNNHNHNMNKSTFQDAALHYAEHGPAVFPLKPRTKVPVEKGGFHNATTDGDQIRTWWTVNPDCNIGFATGDISGIVVIDVDGRDGEHSLAELEQELGVLPETVTQITPGKIIDGRHVGKGRQLFFKTNGTDYRCQAGLAKNIDIRGNGGYIVVPPSIHPDHPADETGTYMFVEELSFDDMEPAELPQAWSDRLLATQGEKRSKAPVEHDLPPASDAVIEACRRDISKRKPAIEKQGGDKLIFAVACTIFHDYGLSEAEGWPILEEYNYRCIPPWTEGEFLRKIDCAIGQTGEKQRGWKRYAKPIEGEYFMPFGAFVLNPGRTQPIALAFRWDVCRHDEGFLLRFYAGNFYWWTGNHYQSISIEEIKGVVLEFLTRAVVLKKDKAAPFPANSRIVNDVLEALKVICFVDDSITSGMWIGDDEISMDTSPIFAQNCVYDWWTDAKYPCSPRWFNLSCVNAVIEDETPEPKRWLRFLDELWGDDQASKDLLHEFMGLCLTLDTSFQKMLLLTGPIRSGKGTIFRITREIIGPENVATPTTASLTQNFGLQPLLGKPLATIADARFTPTSPTSMTFG